jgi:hypothetical protein
VTVIGLALLIMIAVGGGIAIGYSMKPSGALSSAERKELKASRNLIGDLTSMAGEYAALGEAFGVIAQIRINDYRKELNR